MGIERFFSSIEQNNITNLENNFTYKLQKKLDSDYLLVDFNSIVHITSATIISDMNYLLYQIINKTFKGNDKAKNIIDAYKINLNINDDIKYTELTDYLTVNKLDEIIFDKVEEFVLNMLQNFVNPDKLKYLFIAVDGVPNKCKMIEQKKRRFMAAVVGELKDKIFEKYEGELMKNKNRYLYEQNKINWHKIYISPGTNFMNHLDKELAYDKFNKKVKNICKNLKKYTYSGTNEFGEGEKKIVDYAYDNNIGENITVYSPDSDMSLLCLLLSNKFKNITIMRHNQQENNYDIIDVDALKKNIFNYVLNSIKIKTKTNINTKLDSVSIIDDIVFILTIFGNDFLPKLESFNVKYDFDRIIDKYVKILIDNKITYIIDNKTINQNMFMNLMKVLHDDEGKNLQKQYMTSQYQNYEQLKKILEATHENFVQTINDFIEKLRQFNKKVKEDTINMNWWLSNESDFINKLIKLTKLQVRTHNISDHYEFIDNYIKYYKQHNRLPEVKVTFRKYSRSLRNPHYMNNLEKSISKIDPKLKITKYDEEIFKLDNMLDEYAKKLNASSLDLGYVSIDPKTYIWKTENIQKGVSRYYYDFFGVSNIDVKNTDMNKILNDYIEGLMWVFNYYYNSNGNSNSKPNMWFYKYTHAPLLTQLYYFMKNQKGNYINETLNGLDKYVVDSDNFFTPTEHLMYVSPIDIYPEVIPIKYKNKVNSTIDVNRIVNEVWSNDVSDEIDCRGVIFLNKCHITEIHTGDSIIEEFNNDIKFIKKLRT